MNVIDYIRVINEQQDLSKLHHLLLDYVHQQQLQIDKFIKIEISSRKNQRERRITELLDRLQSGDLLLVTELSRLAHNMLETLNLINTLHEKNVQIACIRQPELSTTASHAQLLPTIYNYFANTKREFISIQTKQGLAVAKGQQLGRPKGSRNKKRPLDAFKEQIGAYLQADLSISAIRKLINKQLEQPLTYNSYEYFIQTVYKFQNRTMVNNHLTVVNRDFFKTPNQCDSIS
jgi:DNA invertase Pin-like site-specific DNA recombinase